jgi:hypothetical protein
MALKFGQCAAALLVVGALALAGCGLFSERASYRYRMTVVAETPSGPRSGASVLQVNASKDVALTAHEHPGSAGIQGQAAIVELPGGPVFLLVTMGDAGQLPATRVTKALDPGANSLDAGAFVAAVRRLGEPPFGTKADLPREDWPMMVRFANINDPTSVERVEPEAVGIKRIVLETTDAAVTTGIEKRLRWLPDQRGSFMRRLSAPDPSNPPLAAVLNKFDFSTEIARAE